MVRLISTLALLTFGVAGLPAQEAHVSSETPRAVQLRQLEWQRGALLAMADSMPEALYRDRATPEQRDFAQQIYHAASTVAFACGRYLADTRPSLPDTASALNSAEGLRSYVNAVYDFAVGVLEQASGEDRAARVNFFGLMEIPKWQVWDQIHLHTVWTAGQVVANFRKHGMAPPGFVFF